MIFVKEEEIEYTIGVIRIRRSSTDNTSTKREGRKYRQHIHQKTRSKVQTTHPPKDRVKRTDNTSTKRQGQKYRQHIHQKKGSKVQTTHPPKDKVKSTDNTSTKRQGQKYRQHIHQRKGSKVQTTIYKSLHIKLNTTGSYIYI